MKKIPKKTAADDPGREVNSLRSRHRVLPLEYLLKIINDDRVPMELRCSVAKVALPFVHQKLPPIAVDDLGGPEEPQKPKVDLSKLSDEELEQLEQIVEKAK